MNDRIRLTVNGQDHAANAPPDHPLILWLRDDLGLRAVRAACGSGICGSCTILLDGTPRTACQMTLGEAAGRRIETPESLGDHPVVAALLAARAGQCGWCLSGIALRARALLDAAARPLSRPEIARALDAHLCRCGAQPQILDALETLAQQMTRAPAAPETPK